MRKIRPRGKNPPRSVFYGRSGSAGRQQAAGDASARPPGRRRGVNRRWLRKTVGDRGSSLGAMGLPGGPF